MSKFSELENCNLCPRRCGIDRTEGQRGFCGGLGEKIRVARAALHNWEEPCISGEKGSGTVFFSGCTLCCEYCQNRCISRGNRGIDIDTAGLASVFLKLQNQKAHNINLVTPTHYAPQIKEAITSARRNGLVIPVVYNTGGYERAECIKALDGYVQIYLPDFKYMDNRLAEKYSGVSDYAENCKASLREMVRQCGRAETDENGIMRKGVIVRHLLLPGCLYDSKAVISYLFHEYGNDIYISIMNQYTPQSSVMHDELKRRVTTEEYESLVDYAVSIGVESGFIQEGDTASESFIPSFNGEGVSDVFYSETT